MDDDQSFLGLAILAAAGAAAFFLLPGAARADTSIADQDTNDVHGEADDNADANDPAPVPWEADWPADAAPVPWESGWPVGGDYVGSGGDMNVDVAAILYTIRCCEHVYPRDVVDGACYGIFYAGRAGFNPPELLNQRFGDFSDHPVLTGACRPVPLPPDTCRAAGLNPGCVSTAAGAYQIIRPTWEGARAKLGLADFSPASQDAVAVWLLEKCGAMACISAGDIPGAIAKASRYWASLPGSNAQQNPKQQAYAIARFNEGLALA